ncbi:hypothetical protein Egran_00275 [Elaphomyces granulatus]|uniref:catechol O-methyltransferase n=1 Tax=Elaphomyces granulatus TaxID=519963 RepID=A0A232M6P1_9EURO|nr:hypothetical protein Egran_00275 [Elaphomyces granulatus]
MTTTQPQFVPNSDGRELELLQYVYGLPNLDEIRGHPDKVVAAIDEFVEAKSRRLMNVGVAKAQPITTLISEIRPETMIELGGYVGYSAIVFGDALRRAGGKRYISLELDPAHAAVANMLLDLAGLRGFVQIIIGPSDRTLLDLRRRGEVTHLELLFLDHWKDLYLPDLKLCEEHGLIAPGTVIAADNVIIPGAPDYMDWLRTPVEKKREVVKADKSGNGNPNLLYETMTHEFVFPDGRRDGVEITKCIGVQA